MGYSTTGYSELAQKTTTDTNASNDINQGTDNIAYLKTLVSTTIIGATTLTADTILTDTWDYRIYLLDGDDNTVTLTLPTLAANQGRILEVQCINDDNLCDVDGEGAETIGFDMTSIELPKQGNRLTLFGGATTWIILEEWVSCELRLDTYTAYGATDNKIMQFVNSREDSGNCISHNHGSYGNSGLEITIAKSGNYAFSFRSTDAGSHWGLSLNSAQLTTAIQSINTDDILPITSSSAANDIKTCSVSKYFTKNDIVRYHTDGGVPATASQSWALITYLGN